MPATIMLCSEIWALQILGIFAGWISVNDQAVNAILVTLFAILFMVSQGAQSAACALIGEKIGANRVSHAQAYFKVIAGTTLIFILTISSIVYYYRDWIVDEITEQPDVRSEAKASFYIVLIGFAPDCI